MKLIYILSQGHSGSTLIDCILGSHPDFFPSGELRYLNWQLERTANTPASVEAQTICTCERDWRQCVFWSEVFSELQKITGKDIAADPHCFDTKYFGAFSYQDRDGHFRNFVDRFLGLTFRLWLEKGLPLTTIAWLKPRILNQINNNWLLYEVMAKVSGKPIIIDSSKHLLIALLLQQYRPQDVLFLFIHRDLRRLAASQKKQAIRKSRHYSVQQSIRQNAIFEGRVVKYKRKIPQLKFIECSYEGVVKAPADFLAEVAQAIGLSNDFLKQSNDDFWIDPRSYHMVAGNPMRYRGRQMVRSDESWTQVLSDKELIALERSK